MAESEDSVIKISKPDNAKPSKFLAIDLGAESGRAFVGKLDGGIMSLEEVHRFPNVPATITGHLHWDVSTLFDEVRRSLRLAVEKGHGDIVSIGVDTWGVDFGLVRKGGKDIDPPFTYRDSRTNGVMEKVFAVIPREEVYSITGIQFMQINSLYQLYSMKDEDSGCFENFESLLFMPDIFNYLLTGTQVSEYTMASTSQLLNAESKSFDEKIFSSLGLPMGLMRPVVMPGTVIGKLLPEIASEAGLGGVDVVAVGSHDTASAVAAVPAVGENWAYLSSGTWSLLGIETGEPIIDELSLSNNFTNEGGVGGKITFLRNIIGLWLLQEVRRKWESEGEHYSYDELVKMAGEAREFRTIFNPSDDEFLNPPDMQSAIETYCRNTNQPVPETRGEMVRSIFESLALKYKSAVLKLASITGKTIDRMHVVGGGSRNEMLNRFTADALGIPVTAGPVEATVIGNIMTQAIAKGAIDSFEIGRQVVARSFRLKEYLPRDSKKWDEIYKSAPFHF